MLRAKLLVLPSLQIMISLPECVVTSMSYFRFTSACIVIRFRSAASPDSPGQFFFFKIQLNNRLVVGNPPRCD